MENNLICPAFGGYGGQLQAISFLNTSHIKYTPVFHDHFSDIPDAAYKYVANHYSHGLVETKTDTSQFTTAKVIQAIPLHLQLKLLGKKYSAFHEQLGSKHNLKLFNNVAIESHFVSSYESAINVFKTEFDEDSVVILKPVNGSGSKRIITLYNNAPEFTIDEEYVMQPYIPGEELIVDVCALSDKLYWTSRKSYTRKNGRDENIGFELTSSDRIRVTNILTAIRDVGIPAMCFNMQLRKLRDGNWNIMELDTRFSGSSAINNNHTSLLNFFFESDIDLGVTQVSPTAVVRCLEPEVNNEFFKICNHLNLSTTNISRK